MSDYVSELKAQIKDAYGKVVYTYTTHWKQIDIYSKKNQIVKYGEIILCAITTTGILGYLISNAKWLGIIGAIFSTLSLASTLYAKEMNLDEKIAKHQKTANDLWLIREKYVSLLTDCNYLDSRIITEKRDALIQQVSEINKSALPTSISAYTEAQKALKDQEEQFFSQDELDKLVPEHLRTKLK